MRDIQDVLNQDPEFIETIVLASMELAMADRAWEGLRSEVLGAQRRVSDVRGVYDEARRRFPYAPSLEELLGNVSLMSLRGPRGTAHPPQAVGPRLLST